MTTINTQWSFFISHTKAGLQSANLIARLLRARGYETRQQADFPPGTPFVIEMDRAVRECTFTIAVLSPDFPNRRYTMVEWALALDADKLIPVRVAQFEPTGSFGSFGYVDLVGLDEEAAQNELFLGIEKKARAAGSANLSDRPVVSAASDLRRPLRPSFPEGPGPAARRSQRKRNAVIFGSTLLGAAAAFMAGHLGLQTLRPTKGDCPPGEQWVRDRCVAENELVIAAERAVTEAVPSAVPAISTVANAADPVARVGAPPSTSTALPDTSPLSLEVWATVHGSHQGPLRDGMVLASGDRIELVARTSVHARAHLLYCSGANQKLVIYPESGAITMERQKRQALPAEGKVLRLNKVLGEEALYIVASNKPLTQSDPALARELVHLRADASQRDCNAVAASLSEPRGSGPQRLASTLRIHEAESPVPAAVRGLEVIDGDEGAVRASSGTDGIVILRFAFRHR